MICCLASCKKGYLDKQMTKKMEPMVLRGITKNVGPDIGGYYAGLPGAYENNSKSYPLLLYMHGGGQFGNGAVDLPNLLSEGIPALLDTKTICRRTDLFFSCYGAAVQIVSFEY